MALPRNEATKCLESESPEISACVIDSLGPAKVMFDDILSAMLCVADAELALATKVAWEVELSADSTGVVGLVLD